MFTYNFVAYIISKETVSLVGNGCLFDDVHRDCMDESIGAFSRQFGTTNWEPTEDIAAQVRDRNDLDTVLKQGGQNLPKKQYIILARYLVRLQLHVLLVAKFPEKAYHTFVCKVKVKVKVTVKVPVKVSLKLWSLHT